MTAYASSLEIRISQAAGTTPRMVRFYMARLLAELTLGRQLNPDEAKILGNKIYASYPRINGKHREQGETPSSNRDAGQEVHKALDRAGIQALGSVTPQVTPYTSPVVGERDKRRENKKAGSYAGSLAGGF